MENSSTVPKELPELAIEKYPLDSAFRKEEAKVELKEEKKEPIVIQSNETNSLPLQGPSVMPKEIPKKASMPAPIPAKDEELDTTLDSPEPKTYPKVEPENRVYFKNITHTTTPQIEYPESSEQETTKEDLKRIIKDSFFSRIKSQLKNNNYDYLPDHSQSFLDAMRKHHDTISEKERALKEKSLLDAQLAEKITILELLEEGWYLLRKEIETKQILLLEKEKMIDEVTSDLKALMNASGGFDKKFNESKPVAEAPRVPKPVQDKHVSKDNWFILKDGRKIASIAGLVDALRTMDDETFYYHANSHKNDFSDWVKTVFFDSSLAARVRYARSKEEMARLILD